MRGHMPIPRSIRIPLVLLTAAALAACAGEAWRQGLGAMDLGPVIGFEPGGPHAGQTNAGTTTLSYVYQSEVQAGAPARLRLSGTLQDERRRHMEVNIYVVFLDAGGALRVGPQSAGADPGPAAGPDQHGVVYALALARPGLSNFHAGLFLARQFPDCPRPGKCPGTFPGSI